jgi:MFS transporter, PAT family, beta-lactamase induction signal transducer AmpG
VAWLASYLVMAALVIVGIVASLLAREPQKSEPVEAAHARQGLVKRVIETAYGAFVDFLRYRYVAVILAFVVLYKFTDALAGIMTAPFVYELGFSRDVYAAIIKGVGLAATLIGGFAGGFVARAFSLPASLWIGGILQAVANLAFSWQAIVGADVGWLTFAIVVENFTSAIGTVIFVAYLSALCRNPLHTATQYALLTALAAVGRTYLSSGAGFMASWAGWPVFFALCAAAALPGLALLAWLQRSGHFAVLAEKPDAKVAKVFD